MTNEKSSIDAEFDFESIDAEFDAKMNMGDQQEIEKQSKVLCYSEMDVITSYEQGVDILDNPIFQKISFEVILQEDSTVMSLLVKLFEKIEPLLEQTKMENNITKAWLKSNLDIQAEIFDKDFGEYIDIFEDLDLVKIKKESRYKFTLTRKNNKDSKEMGKKSNDYCFYLATFKVSMVPKICMQKRIIADFRNNNRQNDQHQNEPNNQPVDEEPIRMPPNIPSGSVKNHAIEELKDQGLEFDPEKWFNYAVVGHFNTGKSTLINSLRSLNPDDETTGLAEVDSPDTTQETKMYQFSGLPIRIYDIPGSGTVDRSSETYFNLRKGITKDEVYPLAVISVKNKVYFNKFKNIIWQLYTHQLNDIDIENLQKEYIEALIEQSIIETQTLLEESKGDDIFSIIDNIYQLQKLDHLEHIFINRKHSFIPMMKQDIMKKDDIEEFLVRLKNFAKIFEASIIKECEILELLKDGFENNCFDEEVQKILDLLTDESFCNQSNYLKILIQKLKITSSVKEDQINKLIICIDDIATNTSLKFLDKFKKLISYYRTPYQLFIDKEILQIIGNAVTMSTIKESVEHILRSNLNIREVKFMVHHLKIDVSLSKEIWHAKNVSILAQKVDVLKEVTWDLSGQDNVGL